MKVLCVLLSVLATGLAFECKQCMHMATDNADVNKILDDTMSGAMSGGPISYTADCKDGASNIDASTCPADMGCMSMKINALYAAGNDKVNMLMFMRMCGGKGEMETGCSDMKKYEDKIKESMGASVANLEDMSGAVCVCETDNCNVQKSTQLVADDGGDGGDTGSANTLCVSLVSLLFSLMALLF